MEALPVQKLFIRIVSRSKLSPYEVGGTRGGLGHRGLRAELRHDGGHGDLVRIRVPRGHLEEDAAVATHKFQTEQARVGPVSQSKINLKPLTELSIPQIADEREIRRPSNPVCQLFAYLQTNKASSSLQQV